MELDRKPQKALNCRTKVYIGPGVRRHNLV